MTSAPAELREQFNLPGLTFDAGRGGVAVARIRTPAADADIYLHGAHVTRFAPGGGEDLLFVSDQARFEPGKAIRGGIPICFPWFGGNGPHPDSPAHGFARTLPWTLQSAEQHPDDEVSLHFTLESDDRTADSSCTSGSSTENPARHRPARSAAACHRGTPATRP